MNNNLKQLREAIVKVIPGIMELEFGCEIKGGFEERIVSIAGNGDIRTSYREIPKGEKITILGRPIRFADAVHCLKEKWSLSFQETSVLTSQIARLAAIWNLLQDDLNLQDEPTISFLHQILCK